MSDFLSKIGNGANMFMGAVGDTLQQRIQEEMQKQVDEKVSQETKKMASTWAEELSNQRINDIVAAVEAFIELKAEEVTILSLLEKYFSINVDGAARELLKRAKTNRQMKGLALL